MTKLDHVVARFNGADLTFRIARSDLDLFERVRGRNALASIKWVAAGDWGVADLKEILSLALLSESQVARLRKIYEAGFDAPYHVHELLLSMERRRKGLPSERSGLLASPVVDAAFDRNPPADYAELVIAILTAAVLGIDEADAFFTDEPADA